MNLSMSRTTCVLPDSDIGTHIRCEICHPALRFSLDPLILLNPSKLLPACILSDQNGYLLNYCVCNLPSFVLFVYILTKTLIVIVYVPHVT